jgi:predicted amidohydrolase
MAQINTTVGDFKGNTNKIREAIVRARSLGADLLTLPELASSEPIPYTIIDKPPSAESLIFSDLKGVWNSWDKYFT